MVWEAPLAMLFELTLWITIGVYPRADTTPPVIIESAITEAAYVAEWVDLKSETETSRIGAPRFIAPEANC